MNHKWLWFVAAVLAWLFGSGCVGGLPAKEFKELVSDPTVQETLRTYSQRTDITNPSMEFYIINGVGMRITGVIVRGEVTGENPPSPASQPSE